MIIHHITIQKMHFAKLCAFFAKLRVIINELYHKVTQS